ncbi:MAG: ABC transporter ATP-binding protein/permease [Alphaproteobacteria bacterium]|nr:ABC transporter ATP-binding protein/permease [Alphaproteobacteria bacterium]
MRSPSPTAPANPADSAESRYHRQALAAVIPLLWGRGLDDAELKIRQRVWGALACLLLAKLAGVAVPLLFRASVDRLGNLQNLAANNPPEVVVATAIIGIIVLYGVMRALTSGFGELRDSLFVRVTQRAARHAMGKTFGHLHQLSLSFHLNRQMGSLSRALERGREGMEFLVTFMLMNILPTVLELIMVTAILWITTGITFALITLVTIVGYIVFTIAITEWRTRFRRDMNRLAGEASSKAVDSLLNYETVKYFSNEAHEVERFDRVAGQYEDAATRSQLSLSLLNFGQAVIIAVGMTLIMALAARGIFHQQMTVGDFVLVNAYLLQLYLPLNFLGFAYRQIKQSLIDIEQMFTLQNEAQDVTDKDNASPLQLQDGTVSFEQVSFHYDPRRPVLQDVSFTIPGGKTLAIVGASGSGKSTIARLLFRFYDITGGHIRIDGQDIRSVGQNSLRQQIGVVPQDTVLFNDTLFYNLAYGRPDTPRETVIEAARFAQLDRFIASLPEGYDTMVGERGLKLSGGEKQRVGIARMLLKNPRILILDEATSSLDTLTEKEIQARLHELAANRTTLIIAHRLSTIVDADRILVLSHGQVVEQGRHAELLAADGVYAKMWRQQVESNTTEPVNTL